MLRTRAWLLEALDDDPFPVPYNDHEHSWRLPIITQTPTSTSYSKGAHVYDIVVIGVNHAHDTAEH